VTDADIPRPSANASFRISHVLPGWLRRLVLPLSRWLWYAAWRVRLKWWKLTRDRRIRDHYRTHSIIKVSLGAGSHVRAGWINTDLEPLDGRIVCVDVTRRLPFPAGSVDCFHTEHMIEHLPLPAARSVIRECHRALKPGGRLRISTPDIMRIGRLLFDPGAPANAEYKRWATQFLPRSVTESMPVTSCMIFNNFVRNWGHQFIFDEETLKLLLSEAGFTDLRRCEHNRSDDPNLAGLELRQFVIGDVANEFETMIIEATRPREGLPT